MTLPDAALAADPVIQKLVAWAAARESVRAMLLTSTRARPGGAIDRFSDYDVVLVVRDTEPYATDRRWVEDFGEVLVAYWDPFPYAGGDEPGDAGNVIQYADGLKIDWSLWTVEQLRHLAAAPELLPELDAGYRVLLDKDGLTLGLRPPTYRAYIPRPPDAQLFQTMVTDFFSDVPYVAKCLWRDELLPAKWCLDHDMKHVYLRPMLEWRAQLDHGWDLPVGSLGRGLKRQLPPDLWARLERCYAGAGIEDNWAALYATVELFREVAGAVAAHLGLSYPHELDRRVTAYARAIQQARPE
jgi:aminoglycoside 6-adenylyltransferase